MAAVTGPNSIPEDQKKAENLTRMVTQYQGALRRMCCLYLRDRTAVEDAVQDTFLKAYKHMDTFRSESMERTWLMSIAINTCRDMNRSAWLRHTERRITPEELPLPAEPADEDSLALAQAIRQLPGKHKDVILLYYYQDMTIKEVAEALHAAPSTIAKRLEQAKDKLRSMLAEDDLFPAERREVSR